ncbi:uncharacterized protein SPPG_00174 [Spizellomyces punctatus DAOM BR117]|uniref:Chitin-binding type-2 domain-containing protein n=1 Tax=Spizellomyces punctatus (strain DAOM BR117) TaxID=645134 RepID=A0A0L0HU62_SPIPD|nr:uncharacterized protein SPPG_00174 [Spizellomyces punctatus DAOM BR117]KND04445.1 hypothetical protein SPPG_00174 [Spizellomyces punctatus DAOM BR117]|eukprot:XP_016612484.1 hypothetical protein SPPG_00174 [Spizellomyces punctatus DAOM BR117]
MHKLFAAVILALASSAAAKTNVHLAHPLPRADPKAPVLTVGMSLSEPFTPKGELTPCEPKLGQPLGNITSGATVRLEIRGNWTRSGGVCEFGQSHDGKNFRVMNRLSPEDCLANGTKTFDFVTPTEAPTQNIVYAFVTNTNDRQQLFYACAGFTIQGNGTKGGFSQPATDKGFSLLATPDLQPVAPPPPSPASLRPRDLFPLQVSMNLGEPIDRTMNPNPCEAKLLKPLGKIRSGRPVNLEIRGDGRRGDGGCEFFQSHDGKNFRIMNTMSRNDCLANGTKIFEFPTPTDGPTQDIVFGFRMNTTDPNQFFLECGGLTLEGNGPKSGFSQVATDKGFSPTPDLLPIAAPPRPSRVINRRTNDKNKKPCKNKGKKNGDATTSVPAGTAVPTPPLPNPADPVPTPLPSVSTKGAPSPPGPGGSGPLPQIPGDPGQLPPIPDGPGSPPSIPSDPVPLPPTTTAAGPSLPLPTDPGPLPPVTIPSLPPFPTDSGSLPPAPDGPGPQATETAPNPTTGPGPAQLPKGNDLCGDNFMVCSGQDSFLVCNPTYPNFTPIEMACAPGTSCSNAGKYIQCT